MKSKFAVASLISVLALSSQSYSQRLQPAGLQQEVDLSSASAPSILRVQLGKSLLVTSQETLQRVSVTDPLIASAVVVSPKQVLIHGLKAGTVTFMLWDDQDRARSFNVSVELDLNALRDTIRELFPTETLEVAQSGGSLVLTGNASSKEVADSAARLAGTISPTVVNLVQTATGRQTVMLQVRFAEVDRSAIQQLGVNLFSTGAANTFGATGTQQFGQALGNVGAIPAGTARGSDPSASNLVSGGIGNPLEGSPAVVGLTDLLNVFLFRPDLNLGVAIKALQQRNLLQILAEPNVMATNGTEASFLAGGEFPFPVLQGGAVNAVTIVFKEFGVRLNFTPNIMPDGMIRLKIAPEVSALDFANALTISGFTIPALSTRRVSTEVELRDGQSFAIAGLVDNRLTEIASKIPILGDIPILGQLFKSRATNKSNTELLVVVTPRVVQPTSAAQLPPLPDFPKPFLEPGAFDGKSGETPARPGSPQTPGASTPSSRQ